MQTAEVERQTLNITEYGRNEFDFYMSGPALTIYIIPLKKSHYYQTKKYQFTTKAKDETHEATKKKPTPQKEEKRRR